jgi:hypothetical protein
MKKAPYESLSMESNSRPQLRSVWLSQLLIWAKIKHINSLLAKRHMIQYFRKNMSKIPGDNNNNIHILTHITLIETSILAVYP